MAKRQESPDPLLLDETAEPLLLDGATGPLLLDESTEPLLLDGTAGFRIFVHRYHRSGIMNRLRTACILAGILLSTGSAGVLPAHKFYVSLTEIHCRAERGTIEVSMRIFPDDLDRAIRAITGTTPHIATKMEHDSADAWIAAYLESSFHLTLNDIEVRFNYLGKEPEGGAIWCFLEAELPDHSGQVTIENRVLTEIYEDQKNIVQFYYNDFNKGLLLSRYHPSESLEIGQYL